MCVSNNKPLVLQKPIPHFSGINKVLDTWGTDEATFPAKKKTFHTHCAASSACVGVLCRKQKWNMCKLTHFNSTNSGLALSKHILLVYKEKKVWHCINSLQCFAHWGWTGAEGMDGCPGPTAAWHGGTENPSVWGTLHLLCAAHSPIDMRLPFVLSTKTIQVSPDCCSRLPTQYLTATPNANTKRAEVIIEALTFSLGGVMKDQADLWELRLISLKNYLKLIYSAS